MLSDLKSSFTRENQSQRLKNQKNPLLQKKHRLNRSCFRNFLPIQKWQPF